MPALSLLGAGRLIVFDADQPMRTNLEAHRPLSLILGVGTFIAIPGSYFAPTAFQYASFHCDLSIAAVQFSFSEIGYLQQFRLIGLWI